MEIEYCGRVVRFLIDNHNKNRAVPREDLKELLGTSTDELRHILKRVPDFLAPLGLEMVGVCDSSVVSISDAKKFFLRKSAQLEQSKKSKHVLSLEEKRTYMIFSAIQLENNKFLESKMQLLQRSAYFEHARVRDIFEKLKNEGYLANKKEDEVEWWILGWRFYVEYCDGFDIVDYFKNRATEVNTSGQAGNPEDDDC